MKTLSATLLFVALLLTMVGCGSVEKILPKQGGKWNTVSTAYTRFVNNAADSSWVDSQVLSYVFDKTGSATLTENGGTHTITWYMNPDGDLMTICENTVSSQVCDQYLVLDSSKDSQRWKQTILGSANGSYIEKTVTLARAN